MIATGIPSVRTRAVCQSTRLVSCDWRPREARDHLTAEEHSRYRCERSSGRGRVPNLDNSQGY